MIPFGANSRTNSSLTSFGWISQKTCASRTRRAISCVTCEPKSRMRILSCTNYLFHTVIRRLFDDLNIMHMRFAHPGRSDLDELRLCSHLVDGRAAAVAHAGAKPADELVNNAEDA